MKKVLNNKLLWHLKNDLINFKKLTLNKTIIMGRKTFESLGRLLPNRKHIVISNNYKTDLEDIEITNDIKEIINRYENSEEEVFIIGGASIYKLFIDDVDTMYITEVLKEFDADAFFPEFDKTKWEQENLGENENNDIKFKHIKYKRMI